MSTRRPLDDLPREPLDADEAAIARVQRALPAAEPPAALDARILAQARAAVSRPARRPRPWFLGAGFGAAAAAVMAAGIAWQLGWIGSIPGSATQMPEEASSEDRAKIEAEAEADSEGLERVDVEFIRREQQAETAPVPPVATSAPRPPAAVQKQRAAVPAATSATPSAPPAPPPPPPAPAMAPEPIAQDAAPPAEPAPKAAESTANAAAEAGRQSPQPFPARSGAASSRLGAVAAPSDERKRDLDETESTELESITVTGSRISSVRATLPPWTDDAQLDADAWLERIRERVQGGDRQGAEHSLRRFVLAHPQRAVPRELQRLLVE